MGVNLGRAPTRLVAWCFRFDEGTVFMLGVAAATEMREEPNGKASMTIDEPASISEHSSGDPICIVVKEGKRPPAGLFGTFSAAAHLPH